MDEIGQDLLLTEESRKVLIVQNERTQNLMKDVVNVNERLVDTLKRQPAGQRQKNFRQSLQKTAKHDLEFQKFTIPSKLQEIQNTALEPQMYTTYSAKDNSSLGDQRQDNLTNTQSDIKEFNSL